MTRADDIVRLAGAILPKAAGDATPVASVTPVAGGDINQAWKISTLKRHYFLKTNSPGAYPGMFASEAEGLMLLASTRTVVVPEVLMADDQSQPPFLLLSFEERGSHSAKSFARAGTQLAALHRTSSPAFGLHADNYIGSLPQINKPETGFTVFFIGCRLLPLAIRAVERRLSPGSLVDHVERLGKLLPGLLPDEPPALIHGDLWSGNLMATSGQEPVFIDPAVYFGHRETDLAMTRLFGGFHDAFYQAYQESFPLEPGWEDRTDLFNLYPLLVHLNLFGTGYLGSIQQILRRF